MKNSNNPFASIKVETGTTFSIPLSSSVQKLEPVTAPTPFVVSVVNMSTVQNDPRGEHVMTMPHKGVWREFYCPISEIPKIDTEAMKQLLNTCQSEDWGNKGEYLDHYLLYYFYRVTAQSIDNRTMLSYHLIDKAANSSDVITLNGGSRVFKKPSVILFDSGLLTERLERIIGCITPTNDKPLTIDSSTKSFNYPSRRWKDAVHHPFNDWIIKSFMVESTIANSAKMKFKFNADSLDDPPNLPRMYHQLTDLIFDPTLNISDKFDIAHLFGEDGPETIKRRKRIPEKYWGLSIDELLERVRSGLARARMLLRRQPRVAVPLLFYDKNTMLTTIDGPSGADQLIFGENNLVIPVSLDHISNEIDIAIVLRKTTSAITAADGFIYSSSYYQPITVLSPRMVAKTTRTIQKPDQIWLIRYIDRASLPNHKPVIAVKLPTSAKMTTTKDSDKNPKNSPPENGKHRQWFPPVTNL